jgi:hypothetical protein
MLAPLRMLLSIVADFPFEAPEHKSAWLALVLTLAARPAINGCEPFMLIDANTRGSGKTLLAEAAGDHRHGSIAGVKPTEPVSNGPRGQELFSELSERWFEDRKRRCLSSIDTDRGRMRNHVWPLLSARPIGEVTQDGLRGGVESLDGVSSWRTAQQVWGLVTKLFSDACQSKSVSRPARSSRRTPG